MKRKRKENSNSPTQHSMIRSLVSFEQVTPAGRSSASRGIRRMEEKRGQRELS